MTRTTLSELLDLELITPIRLAAIAADKGAAHWSNSTPAEILELRAKAEPHDPKRWRVLGDLWLRKGNFVRAAATYGTAIEIAPDDGALYARRAEALATIDPDNSAADAARAVALGAALPAPQPPLAIATPAADAPVATIYADVTDMMEYLKINNSMSGIQRVVANMFRSVEGKASPNARDVVPVIPDYRAKIVYAADPILLYELIDTVERGQPTREHLNRLLAALWASLRRVDPAPGSIFLMAGAFWIADNYDLLKELRERGVAITIFIHDLIQIDNPEYVAHVATIVFRRALVDVAEFANFFTTNSHYVAREVRRFLREDMEIDKPVHAVPLATEMSLVQPDPWQDSALQLEFGENGYVLCVCTLEIRKNHMLLMHVWEALIRSGRTDVPKLVLVGKWGWEIDELREFLDRTDNLGGMIRVMANVPDTVLAGLYRNCRFTIYPSFAEGWGLPVGESLVFGKPCLCSGVTSIPEVSGTLSRYFDPFAPETALPLVEQLLDDPADLEAWTAHVVESFRPRGWSEFAEHLLGATRALAASTAGTPPAFARLTPGRLAILGSNGLAAIADAGENMRTMRMGRGNGWHSLEDNGVWSSHRVASVRFLAEGCRPGDRLKLAVELSAGRADQPRIHCMMHSNAGTSATIALTNRGTFHAWDAVVDNRGVVELTFIAQGGPIHFDARDVYLFLHTLGYHRSDSAAESLTLMEAIRFRA